MGYTEDIKKVAAAHAEEIRGDLDLAHTRLHQQQMAVHDLERQIVSLEMLLELTEASQRDEDPSSQMTLHGAMALVLREQPMHMMRPADLLSEVNRRRLYKMRDGRPVELQQIHARVGNYSHLFTRDGTFIKLID